MSDSCLGAAGPAPVVGRLTATQREMVERNLGLVVLHIRRKVAGLNAARPNREFDDLFQEGCCGLIEAVQTFDPQRGIPFAVYARPRIQTAVSIALHVAEPLVRGPHRRRGRRKAGGEANPCEPRPPMVTSLRREPVDRRRPLVESTEAGETVGERMRRKYDAALGAAVRTALRRKARRGDRGVLVSRVIEERMQVPEEDAKTPLREIARGTRSSYARVLQCERRLVRGVRRALRGDVEFQALRRMARGSAEGTGSGLDDAARGALRRLSAEGFWRRVGTVKRGAQDAILARLLREAGAETVKTVFAGLPDDRADALLEAVKDE